MSVTGRKVLSDDGSVWEALPDVREWSDGPPRCPRVARSSRETLPDVREWSGGHPGCLRVVGWLSRMSGCGR